MLESDRHTEINVATTLSKIGPEESFLLLLRGYVGTWLASAHLAPIADNEVSSETGRTVIERLRRISGMQVDAA